MMSFTARILAACAISTLAFGHVAAAAKSANSLSDLVGAKAAGAECDMESRGWQSRDGHKSNTASYAYWWNNDRRACVMVTTRPCW